MKKYMKGVYKKYRKFFQKRNSIIYCGHSGNNFNVYCDSGRAVYFVY